MLEPIIKSSRFIEEYKKYKTVIESLPDSEFKTSMFSLLGKLANEVKKMDNMFVDMVYSKQLPTIGNDIREQIIQYRKELDFNLKKYMKNV